MEVAIEACDIDGCGRPVLVRKVMLCASHYASLRKYGQPIPPPKIRVCAACFSEFMTKRQSGKPPLYCSRQCSNWASSHRGEPLPPFRGCGWCGADIRTRPSQRYCSLLCGQIGRGEVLYGPRQQLDCANPECGKSFLKYYPRQNCCSEKCGKRRWHLQAKADGYVMPRRPWDDIRRDRYHRRRAQQRATRSGAPVLRDAIGDRDRWKCGACGKKVNRNVAYPDPRSPSIDHVIPLSKGGEHTPENTRITHLECNLAKGDRGGGEQLLLVG